MGARAFYVAPVSDFLRDSTDSIVGKISQHHSQDIVAQQMGAWLSEIEILKACLPSFSDGHVLLELQIPRMGRRVDAAIVVRDILFVLEFKVGAKGYHSHDLRQAHGYAIDLHHFHEGSHGKTIVPVLVATEAPPVSIDLSPHVDHVYPPLRANAQNLGDLLEFCLRDASKSATIDFNFWLDSRYKPTPTIIEAAQALYANHDVADIARNDAGAENLNLTSAALLDIVHQARIQERKVICFVTGVPGAGKTLVGLNLATSSVNVADEEHAVFLSGNGPLVEVLVEALARDARVRNPGTGMEQERRRAQAKIQNIHKFRDAALVDNGRPPIDRVVVFDEAQRAWNLEATAKFMVQKRDMKDFCQSEPEFLISVMDRHKDWCAIIALVGGGQEINNGEAGLQGWVDALSQRFSDWDVYYSDKLSQAEYVGREVSFQSVPKAHSHPGLHLATSMRSFRAEKLSHFVHYLIHGQPEAAAACYESFRERFPIAITRDAAKARQWIRERARANETKGLVASSGGMRLKPKGIFVKNKISAADWFLNDPDDVRSCHYLEDVATEFDVQGLELDWCLVAWDADFRNAAGEFEHWKFVGNRWQRRQLNEHKRYLENAYRVLLTRARQGMVIFVPHGNAADWTRDPRFYQGTYDYLLRSGLPPLK